MLARSAIRVGRDFQGGRRRRKRGPVEKLSGYRRKTLAELILAAVNTRKAELCIGGPMSCMDGGGRPSNQDSIRQDTLQAGGG